MIGAPCYELAKFLMDLLSSFVGQCEHHIQNSVDFVNSSNILRLTSFDSLVCFDVVSWITLKLRYIGVAETVVFPGDSTTI